MIRRAEPHCDETIEVTVQHGYTGPYEMIVVGRAGGPWEWTLIEDGEIIAESDEPTEEAAKRAVERMAEAARQIAAGNLYPEV